MLENNAKPDNAPKKHKLQKQDPKNVVSNTPKKPRKPLIDFLAIMGIAIIAPWFWRTFRIFELGSSLGLVDIRGYFVDFWICVPIAYLLLLCKRLHRAASICLLILWGLVNCASYEHIRALGIMPDVANVGYLGDNTVLLGSVIAITHPIALALQIVTACVVFWFYAGKGLLRLQHLLHSSAFLFGILLLAIWGENPLQLSWRQNHFIPANTITLLSSPKELPESDEIVKAAVSRACSMDLNGKIAYRSNGKKPNILLIILEGMTGQYVKAIRKHHNREFNINLPCLHQAARKNIYCPNFINQQAMTNRGEYAIIAGDYPKLLTETPKMTEVATGTENPKKFLPALLRKAGYLTAYMQPAELGFMVKDKFMSKAGYEIQYGYDDFKKGYAKNNWGVDDQAFFEQTHKVIKKFDGEKRPWFVTLMTSGAHHPYRLPKFFTDYPDEDERARAFYYGDRALGIFLSLLSNDGLLENTLVIITSDEASVVHNADDPFKMRLDVQWGILIVITPQKDRGIINGIYAQSDIALSIMDYVGLAGQATHLTGRSFFRSYAGPRNVFFANTYFKQVGVLDTSGGLLICNESFEPIIHQRYFPQAIYMPGGAKLSNPPVSLLAAMAKRVRKHGGESNTETYILFDKKPCELVSGICTLTITSGLNYCVKEDSILSIDIDAVVRTEHKTRVELVHRARLPGRTALFAKTYGRFLDNGRLRLRYHYRTGGPLDGIDFLQVMHHFGKGPTHLEFKSGQFRITPVKYWNGRPLKPEELYIEEEDVELAPPGTK